MKLTLGRYLKQVREEHGLAIRDLCRKVEQSKIAGRTISPAYYCQVENESRLKPEKISFDFFWAVSIVLGTDPVDLFILSRCDRLPISMLDRNARRRVFVRHLGDDEKKSLT